MGNYYEYELEILKGTVEELPKIYFEEPDLISNLFLYKYVRSKRWDMIKDMCRLSEKYPNVLFEVKSTDEDSNELKRTLFKNGQCQTQLGQIVYPEINELDFNDPLEEQWNFNSDISYRKFHPEIYGDNDV